MRKVLSEDELSQLLDGERQQPSLEELVAPTAEDLLALTQDALNDVDSVLPLTDDQREALREALKRRLLGAVADQTGADAPS